MFGNTKIIEKQHNKTDNIKKYGRKKKKNKKKQDIGRKSMINNIKTKEKTGKIRKIPQIMYT